MAHVDAMLGRLPFLYRDGALLRQLLAVPGLQVEVVDEQAAEVQRAHWFDATLERDEAARLAALVDIPPEPWQDLAEYRAWVHELRDARLELGAVTGLALTTFVAHYTAAWQRAARVVIAPSKDPLELVETPRRRHDASAPVAGGIEPLHRFRIVQGGLDETPAAFLLTGLASGPEYLPVIANLTTGHALVFRGAVPPGARLWLRPTDAGGVDARLERDDVSARLYSVRDLKPGTPWSAAKVEHPARALVLARGANDLWFLPVAHYDDPGLDRALLALADLVLAQGRFDDGTFDHALFHQPPAVTLRASWVETTPATFTVDVRAGAMLAPAGPPPAERLVERERLGFALDRAVQTLRAAGVTGGVRLRPFTETQPQMDFPTGRLPLRLAEAGPTGADRLPDAGGVFGVTDYDDSTFR